MMNKEKIINAAISAGFTDKDYGLNGARSVFDGEIGVEEYACGEMILRFLKNLGIEITDGE
jgi:hypothetical protein